MEGKAFKWNENRIENNYHLFGTQMKMQQNENGIEKNNGSNINFFHYKWGMKTRMKSDSKHCLPKLPSNDCWHKI